MPVGDYDVGDLVRIESWDDLNPGGFALADGTPTDPTTVTLRLQEPDGTVTDYIYPANVTKLSAGKFYKDVLLDDSGVWRFRWIGTGAVQAAAASLFLVRLPVPA